MDLFDEYEFPPCRSTTADWLKLVCVGFNSNEFDDQMSPNMTWASLKHVPQSNDLHFL